MLVRRCYDGKPHTQQPSRGDPTRCVKRPTPPVHHTDGNLGTSPACHASTTTTALPTYDVKMTTSYDTHHDPNHPQSLTLTTDAYATTVTTHSKRCLGYDTSCVSCHSHQHIRVNIDSPFPGTLKPAAAVRIISTHLSLLGLIFLCNLNTLLQPSSLPLGPQPTPKRSMIIASGVLAGPSVPQRRCTITSLAHNRAGALETDIHCEKNLVYIPAPPTLRPLLPTPCTIPAN